MGISATLGKIRKQAATYSAEAFLLTVDASHHPHCIPTSVAWADDTIVVRAPSKLAASEVSGHRHVSLLWPPAQSGGYSLIVDGVAQAVDAAAGQQLSITPTRAVLHRSDLPTGESESSCGSDCVPIFSS